jgi:hypothetical protein
MLRNTLKITFFLFLFCLPTVTHAKTSVTTPPNLKIGYIGDVGVGSGSGDVLKTLKNNGAEALVIVGDFDYKDDPERFIKLINNNLGSSFPVFITVGNHDINKWGDYQKIFQERLSRLPNINCVGDLGINSYCDYKGVRIILSGIGTFGNESIGYIRNALENSDTYIWKNCTWHKNQNAMQVGGKGDEVGWEAYEACKNDGAIILTGHEHSYSRTKTLTSMVNQTVNPSWPDPSNILVGPGNTFAAVVGLGGHSVRHQIRCLPSTYPYGCNSEWAKIYTSNQGADFGGLLITYNIDSNPRKAKGQFININKEIVDTFYINSENAVFFLKGDINKDYHVDLKDVLVLLKYLFN